MKKDKEDEAVRGSQDHDQQGSLAVDTKTSNENPNEDANNNVPQEFADSSNYPSDKSLCIFSKTNCLRANLVKLTRNKWFENTILILIVISSLQLAIDEPFSNPKSPKIYYFNLANYIFTIVFLLELIFKVIATGLLFNGSQSYLRDSW